MPWRSRTATPRTRRTRAAVGRRARAAACAAGPQGGAQDHHQVPRADASAERGRAARRRQKECLMSRIVAGRFDRSVDADAALDMLKRDGFSRSEVDAFYVGPPGQNARTP